MAHPGTLHHYHNHLVAFEHTPSPTPSQNLLLFIGGLGEGLLNPSYPSKLPPTLPPTWHIVEVLLTSSHTGWTTGSLSRDATELALCVSYFRARIGEEGMIVLMGHSTGCQDVMEYLVGEGAEARPAIQGAILQAGISDREGVKAALEPEVFSSGVALAKEMVGEGRGGDVLPMAVTKLIFGASPSAERWLSLVEMVGEGDDFFSSDLRDDVLKATFGKIGGKAPVCFLLSGSDEFMPPSVDKEKLIERWTAAVKAGGGSVDEVDGGVVSGASHGYEGNSEEVLGQLFRRVVGFLGKVEGGKF